MTWGTRHDRDIFSAIGEWDLSEGFLTAQPEPTRPPLKAHSPSGEPEGDDGAGNPSPRAWPQAYGGDDSDDPDFPEDWTFGGDA